MKTLLFLLLIYGLPAFSYNCPSSMASNKMAQKTHSWMERFKGQFDVHGCYVELVTCEISDDPDESAPVGEVFIQTPDGREAYVEIDFPNSETDRFKTQTKVNKRTLSYIRKDRYFEPVNGRTEVWRLEIRTLWDDLNQLDVTELGIYGTNRALNQPNGNDSRWFVCSKSG